VTLNQTLPYDNFTNNIHTPLLSEQETVSKDTHRDTHQYFKINKNEDLIDTMIFCL